MGSYYGAKIGESAYPQKYTLVGFFLQHDGCMAVGVDDEGRPQTDWTDGFNRKPEAVIEQVNSLPLTKEEKLELVRNGIFPKGIKIESHQYWKGYPRKGMFEGYEHLIK